MSIRFACTWILGIMGFLAYSQKTFVKQTYFDQAQEKVKELITLNETDSTLQGLYQSLYLNGSLAVKGYYNQDVSDSVWTYYYENGRERATGKYRLGKQADKWVYYFENGQRKAEGFFNDQGKTGIWKYYFENGVEKSVGRYENNEKTGIWNYFYEDATLKAQAFYQQGRGIYKEFYPSGALKAEGVNQSDQSIGPWTYYYESGEKEAEGEFEAGARNGTWVYYHKNGEISATGKFQNGEKEGSWTYYYADGSLNARGEMIQNQQDGFWKLYYPSGEIKGEAIYEIGNGEFIEYYQSGKLKAKGTIVNGKKEGPWVYYNEEGFEDGTAIFDQGIGKYTGYYRDGTIKMEGTIDDGKRKGEWILYKPDGSVVGMYKPVYEDEKPIFRTTESITEITDNRKTSDKPEYRFKNNKIRYFEPRINEYRGFIISSNPLMTLWGHIPVGIEMYVQERLGYEIELNFHRQPFFRNPESVTNEVFKLGGEIHLRQKFYHSDGPLGMFYFGHQLSGGYIEYGANVIDSTNAFLPDFIQQYSAQESRFAYGLLIGNRWMQRAGDSGITVDLNVGLGLGRRFFSLNEPNDNEAVQIFDTVNQNGFYIPIIFTLNIGLTGPKRRTTSN